MQNFHSGRGNKKNNVTANNEQTDLTTGDFVALANADALNDATEDLVGLELTFDRIKFSSGGSTAFEILGEDRDGVVGTYGIAEGVYQVLEATAV